MHSPQQPRKYRTEEAAEILRYRAQSLRRELCIRGHFHGLVPTKLPGGRLLWDANDVDALASGRLAGQC